MFEKDDVKLCLWSTFLFCCGCLCACPGDSRPSAGQSYTVGPSGESPGPAPMDNPPAPPSDPGPRENPDDAPATPLPVISAIATEVSGNEARITWTTDVPATSRVETGFTDFDGMAKETGALVTSHAVTLALAVAGVYRCRVVSISAAGAMAQADAGTFEIVAPNEAPLGTPENPIAISAAALPVSFNDSTRSTVNAPSSAIDHYSPASQDEMGPEYVYRLTLAARAVLSATVSDGIGVDIDLHLLGALAEGTRTQALFGGLASMRADATLGPVTLEPGTYHLVLDTYGPDATKAGAYSLSVQLNASSSGGEDGSACTASDRPAPNGVPAEQDYQNGCPPGMIKVPAATPFCIDKYEAMLVGIDATGGAFPWSPFANPGTQKIKALSVANAVPQGYINKLQARSACDNAGKRLCKNSEWTRACKGALGTTYPYGATRLPGVCNDARSPHPAIQYFGADDPNVWSKLGHPCINQQADTLDRSGLNTGCVSQDGALDMMGNLHEWIEDLSYKGTGMFRGGYYVDTVNNGNGCDYTTTAHGESHWDYSTGFRCCADF